MKYRSTLINTDFNKSLFHQFTFGVNKCGGSCNTNFDPYSQVCVTDKIKICMSKYLTNLRLGINEKIFSIQHQCVRVNED